MRGRVYSHVDAWTCELYFCIRTSSSYCRRLRPASIPRRINSMRASALPYRAETDTKTSRGLAYASSRLYCLSEPKFIGDKFRRA